MQTLASKQELADWVGEPITSDSDTKRAGLCLRIASALVRAEAGRTWDPENTGETVPEAAQMVTLYCASRVYENREAENQSGVDNWQASRQVMEAGAYLTASEKRLIAQLNKPRHGGLGTVATTKQEHHTPSGWVPTGTPEVEFPWY